MTEETSKKPQGESYPPGWRHAMIHLNPATMRMHSDGDHSVRMLIEEHFWKLASRIQELQTGRGCLLTGPARGDCAHFIGMPSSKNPEKFDEYGRPEGWCQVCWLEVKLARSDEGRRKAEQACSRRRDDVRTKRYLSG